MSHPHDRRHSGRFDDGDDDALAMQHPQGGHPPPPHGHGPPPPGAYGRGRPPHPHAVPSIPPPGGRGGPPPPHHLPPGHHHGPPPPHGHPHHPHHLPPHMGPPPPGSAGAPGFLHQPGAFNQGLAAAIAAAEYQKHREASAHANVFAAAHANGLQPFIPGFPPGHPRHGPPPPGYGPPPPGVTGRPSPLPPHLAHGPRRPGMSPPAEERPKPKPAPAPAHIPNNMPAPNPAHIAPVVATPRMPIFSNGRPELPPPKWFDASCPLGVVDDKYYLSELQCVLRSEFVEVFGTTATDIVLPVHGRNKPIALGQVGVRCQHCKDVNPVGGHPEDAEEMSDGRITRVHQMNNAVSYPSFISGIYNVVQQMYRLHFDTCEYIPEELKERVSSLKDSHTSNRGGRKQYWIEAAKRIGLVDTSFGIHYGRDPLDPLPPLIGSSRRDSSTSVGVDEDDEDAEYEFGDLTRETSGGSYGDPQDDPYEACGVTPGGHPSFPIDDVEIYPLVLPDDKPLISDYLYLALEQMQPCNLMDADRVGCYKGRRTGFPGLACKHCIGQAGCGRYFPASEASLSQTTTSQTIVNHVRNCRRCPMEIREQLELMKRAKTCPEYKKQTGDKPKHGGRKVFFHRLWCRIQRIPLPKEEAKTPPPESPTDELSSSTHGAENPAKTPEKAKKRKADGEKEAGKKPRRSSKTEKAIVNHALDGSPNLGLDDEDDTEIVKFNTVHNDGDEPPAKIERVAEKTATPANSEENHVRYRGRARLTRDDDPHWLSEADCYIRQELCEVFTATEEDVDLYGDPEIGQVGIRCFYCAENKAPEDRSRGHIYFPSNVGGVQQAVSDLQRRHLGICSEIPEGIRKSFQSMKGYGSKPKGDTAQYWVDAARELGLHDSHEGQGISFFRNPLENSPADEIDMERNEDGPTGSVLVPPEDRGKCTDHMLLLLKQFEPCQFRTSDRKSSRSRDRAIGFPGLVCVHCEHKRYFPITEKKLQDSLTLMTTHINNCFHAPLDVKASLCYLQHRSLLQKQELSGQWKFTFFKGVWNRLHQGHSATESSAADFAGADADASMTADDVPSKDSDEKDEDEDTNETPSEDVEAEPAPPVSSASAPMEAQAAAAETNPPMEHHQLLLHHALQHATPAEEPGEGMGEMKGLIKAAALWLTERDAEYEARGISGRGRGMKRR